MKKNEVVTVSMAHCDNCKNTTICKEAIRLAHAYTAFLVATNSLPEEIGVSVYLSCKFFSAKNEEPPMYETALVLSGAYAQDELNVDEYGGHLEIDRMAEIKAWVRDEEVEALKRIDEYWAQVNAAESEIDIKSADGRLRYARGYHGAFSHMKEFLKDK